MCMSCSRLQLDAKPPFVYLVREGSIIKSNETIEEKEIFLYGVVHKHYIENQGGKNSFRRKCDASDKKKARILHLTWFSG